MAKCFFTSKAFSIYLDPDKAWEIIETGRNIDDLYPSHFKNEVTKATNEKILETILDEGEQYVLLEFTDWDYAITSYARIYNCKNKRFINPMKTTDTNIFINIRQQSIDFKTIFQQQGWIFDMDVIKSRMFSNI